MIKYVSVEVKRDYVLVIVWKPVMGRAVCRTVTNREVISLIDIEVMIGDIRDVIRKVLYKKGNHLFHLRSLSCEIFVVASIREFYL